MNHSYLLNHFIESMAIKRPEAVALVHRGEKASYQSLAQSVDYFAKGTLKNGILPGERIAIFLNKSVEFVITAFGASKAGAVFVPINPVLKEKQVDHIVRDSESSILVTSKQRLNLIINSIEQWDHIKNIVVLMDEKDEEAIKKIDPRIVSWKEFQYSGEVDYPSQCDSNIASLFYTSGSTGSPKGVILSQQNMVLGAKSVASYLKNSESDNILATLPLSFDAGFSQLTTGFYSGATIVLHDYFNASDLIRTVEKEDITGITAVPPILIDIFSKENISGLQKLRYVANTGGHLPQNTVVNISEKCKEIDLYLMYGLTEAFRSTYLKPDKVQSHPGSIGKAIPNVEISVIDECGNECKPGETGELIHKGPLVAKGYWKLPKETQKRFKKNKSSCGKNLDELVVFSGDLVRRDKEGYIYFVGRKDQMIKTSGYRVSTDEIEDIIYKSGLVSETAIIGIEDERVGNKIICYSYFNEICKKNKNKLAEYCCKELPHYMVPEEIYSLTLPLPKNNNGKIDRNKLKNEYINES